MWKVRNDAAFNGSLSNPLGTFFQIVNSSSEFLQAHDPATNPTPLVNRIQIHFNGGWRPPSSLFVKINSDATYNKDNGKGAIGVICRDGKGILTMACAKKIFASSPLAAKALGLREAVVLAMNLGLPSVIFESDSLDLIEICRGNKNKEEIRGIISDIQEFKSSFQHCGFT